MTRADKILPINELYTCIQGEGPLLGIPHLLIRFLGCPLRCAFSDSFCDSSFNSWSPEKGSITINDIIELIDSNKYINHVMITGGSPTMHKDLLLEIVSLFKKYEFIITLETEGTNSVEGLSVDYVSLSPKNNTSTPIVGTVNNYTNKEVTESDVRKHKKNLFKWDEMRKLLRCSTKGFWIKPVITNLVDDIKFLDILNRELEEDHSKYYLMPEGDSEEILKKNSKEIVQYCINEGYNFTPRLHINIYGNKRGV